MHSRLPDSLGY